VERLSSLRAVATIVHTDMYHWWRW